MDEKEFMREVISETTKKSIGKMVDGLGAFFSRICMPAADEIGLFLRDRVRLYRIINLQQVVLKTQKKLENKKIINKMEPKSLIEFTEKASWIEDDDIQHMWAGLLVGTLTNKNQPDTDLIYYNLLNGINPYQARIINLIYGDNRICSFEQPLRSDISYDELNLQKELTFPLLRILEISPKPLDYIVENQNHIDILNNEENHWIAFGYTLPNITHLRRIELIKAYEFAEDQKSITFVPTLTGLDFYMNCTGEKIYPLEAYLVARKYWYENDQKKTIEN